MDPEAADEDLTPKQQMLASLAKLPDDASFEDAIELIVLLEKLERSYQDIKAGRMLTNEEVQARMAHWLK